MSAFTLRWCKEHGYWDDDVDSPAEACPTCIESGAFKTRAQLERQLAEALANLEQCRVQLAGCGVIAGCNTRTTLAKQLPTPDAYGYSASLLDVAKAVTREMNERERAERAETKLAALQAKPDVAGLVEAMKVTQFQVDEDGTNIGVSRQAVEEARTALAVQAHDIEAYRACLGYTVSGDHDGRLCDGTLPNNGIAQALSAQLQEKEAEYERLKAEKKMLVDTILASGMSAEVLQQSLDSARKESK